MVVVGLVAELGGGVCAVVNVGMVGVVNDIGGAGRHQLLDEFDHFVNSLGGSDVVLRWQHPQSGHILAKQLGLL